MLFRSVRTETGRVKATLYLGLNENRLVLEVPGAFTIADISYVIENPTQGFHMPCEGGMDEDLVFEATCGTTGTDGVSPLTDSGSVFVESCKGGTALGDVGCGVDSAVLPVVGIKKFFDIDWGPYLPNVPAACPPGCDHPCEQWGGFFEAVTNPGVQCTWSLQCWDMASPRGGCVKIGRAHV